MDCTKIGNLICKLRKEKNMTQKQVADALGLSDRTVSKWERGLGCPDISLLSDLSSLLNVNIKDILSGDLISNDFVGGNMKNSKYYVCPVCGNMVLATGSSQISCCGRMLEPMELQKAEAQEKLMVETVEDEWFISSNHPMEKKHHISFVAFATGDRVQIVKQYPEWNLQLRIFKQGHGMLIWHCTNHGLFYQLL